MIVAVRAGTSLQPEGWMTLCLMCSTDVGPGVCRKDSFSKESNTQWDDRVADRLARHTVCQRCVELSLFQSSSCRFLEELNARAAFLSSFVWKIKRVISPHQEPVVRCETDSP